jgi:hypothetical protein
MPGCSGGGAMEPDLWAELAAEIEPGGGKKKRARDS